MAASPGLPRTPPSARRASSNFIGELPADEYLFEAPADLVCPLTLAPFIDPVLTSAGHVYERAAIQAHLEHNSTDPLTRTPLLNKSLTPVYVLRSRALEYRESVAKACVERVCSPEGGPVAEPMRYLRRAVELIADTGHLVQGLSKETVDYVLAHSSNAFDSIALQLFAQGLFQAGYRDRAAAIYSCLLLEDADRMQQAELLRRCLSCWTDDDCSQADDHVFQKLVALFEGRASLEGRAAASLEGGVGRPALSWDQLVDLAQHAQLGDQFVLRLCEQLLFRPMPPAGGEEGCPASGAQQEKQRLLLRYVHVLTDSVQQRQTKTEQRLQDLERWQRQRGGGSRANSLAGDGSGASGAGRLPRWMRSPAALVVFALLVSAVPDRPQGRLLPERPLVRLLRMAPLVALLPPAGS